MKRSIKAVFAAIALAAGSGIFAQSAIPEIAVRVASRSAAVPRRRAHG